VLEELDVAVETQIRVATPVWGRLTGHVPCHGELTPEAIEQVLLRAAKEAGLAPRLRSNSALRAAVASMELPMRRPTLCAGCGHRAAFYAMRRSFPDAIFPGDIGCYTLGLNLGGVDTVHDMGASISMAAGFYHAYAQDGEVPPIFATIGDGTFFHSGAAGLENAVCNGAKFVLVVLDNATTGMTGMQPTPECGGTADGHHGTPVNLEALIRGCGIAYVATANPYDLPGFQGALADAHEHTRGENGGVAVVIARYVCVNQMKGLGPDKQATPVVVRKLSPAAVLAAKERLPHYENSVSPCCVACPAGNDIEKLMALVGAGRFEAAAQTLYQEHPFPSTLGRVCPQPCETACNRRDLDGAVSIRAIERAAGDAGRSAATFVQAGAARGRSVAVVGGGPAGLTAAYHLARLGYAVEIFEAREAAGGLLRWGIPEFRLPAQVLGREMEVFAALGIQIHTQARIGENLPWSALERFAAVCVSIGAWRERRLGVAGEDLPGVVAGMEFLRQLRTGQTPQLGRQVAVIGGGNTAIDVARSARRLGAEVTIYSAEAAFSAIEEEVLAAAKEGIGFRFNMLQTEIAAGKERKLALHLREVRDWRPDATAPAFVGAAEFIAEVDSIVVAIGAVPAIAELAAAELGAPSSMAVDDWGRTASPRVFAAGDATSRAAGTVTGAVNAGKRAALAIHAELSEEMIDKDALRLVHGPGVVAELVHAAGGSSRAQRVQISTGAADIKLHHFAKAARAGSRQRSAEESLWGFEEVDLGISPETAVAEAGLRCFHCGVCTECDICVKVCPVGAIGKGEDGGYRVDAAKCTACRLCQTECPRSAITMPAQGGCVACGYCTTWFECPSIVRQASGEVDIDRRTCVDCGMCTQVCAQGAIQYAPALAMQA
jgi:NADPH-dependent glutamate synthase beta subunit-like oxidoreductase/Pyruvate/2-oxoacid:ferredoxin oxidoreductase delta subunit